MLLSVAAVVVDIMLAVAVVLELIEQEHKQYLVQELLLLLLVPAVAVLFKN